jgi:hypothetical protein
MKMATAALSNLRDLADRPLNAKNKVAISSMHNGDFYQVDASAV